MKRNEIRQLQAKLVDRDKAIQAIKQREDVYLAECENFKVNSKTSCKYGDAKTGVMKTGLQTFVCTFVIADVWQSSAAVCYCVCTLTL